MRNRGPIEPKFYREKPIELGSDDWRSERNAPKPKGRYPRKTWFGLTDYGPPPITWQTVIGIVIAKVILVLLLTG